MLTLNERIKIVKEMHEHMVNEVECDDLYYDVWCCVVPDEADEADFKNIAEDPDLWRLAVKTFCEVIAEAEERGGY